MNCQICGDGMGVVLWCEEHLRYEHVCCHKRAVEEQVGVKATASIRGDYYGYKRIRIRNQSSTVRKWLHTY